MNIAEKIQASGATDKQISNATGRSIPVVWRWRKGLTKPNVDNVAALARAIGCKPADLIPKEVS